MEVSKGRTTGMLREDGRSSEASEATLEHQLLFRCNGLSETRLPSYQDMHHRHLNPDHRHGLNFKYNYIQSYYYLNNVLYKQRKHILYSTFCYWKTDQGELNQGG